MWDKIVGILSKAFDGLYDHATDVAADFFRSQVDALKISGTEFLANELDPKKESYYDEFGGSKAVIEFLKKHDRNPNDDTLDLMKYVPSWMEEKAVRLVAPRAYRTVVKQIKKALEESGE